LQKSLPKKATKHIPKKQLPIGSTRKGKLKVMDGKTGKIKWRSLKSGALRDLDGDPISPKQFKAQKNKEGIV
jgi:glucose dehydrogenase